MDENDNENDKESLPEEEPLSNQEKLWLEEDHYELEFSDEEFEREEQDFSNEEDLIYSFEGEEEEELGEFANGLTSDKETEEKEGSMHHISPEESLSNKSGKDNTEMINEPNVLESESGLSGFSEDVCMNMGQPDFPDILSSATSLQKMDTLQLYEDHEVHETTAYPEPDLPDFIFTPSGHIQEEILSICKPEILSDEAFNLIMQMDTQSRLPDADAGKAYHVSVEIERLSCKKPFLGGYRNKTTGKEYHNASSQTRGVMQNEESWVEKSGFQLSHETQTKEQQHLLMQTRNDKSTQMTGIGIYIPNVADRLIEPSKYITADECQDRMLQQVITIQKYYRRWLAKVNVEALLAKKKCLDELRKQKQHGKDSERRTRLQMEHESRLHPRTNRDFDLLFTYLEKWRRKEVDRIDKTLSGANRKAALCDLMDRQAQLIHCIGLRRLEIADDLHLQFVESFLNKVVAPKNLSTVSNQVVVENDSTLRAKELKEVFQTLNVKYLTADERLDLLVTVKSILQLHPCSVSAELEKLVDRENELLTRGFSDRSMDGLRRRISNLFLQYIRLPMVNPAAARFAKVPSDPLTLKGNTTLCPSCHCYLSTNDFHLASNQRKLGRCRACNQIDNQARKRKDFSIFRYMLKNLCRSEDLYNDNAKTAYLMQEKDIRYLIVYIWHSKSILSAHDDLYDLEIVRWNRCEEWSPWNCVLLTKEEAQAHNKFQNLEQAYGKDFIHDVHCKHLLAKKYFYRLLTMVRYMPNTSDDSTTAVRNLMKKYPLPNKCT